MFDIIDAKTLRAAERAAKMFASLTGKDNFSFARLTVIAILGWFAIYSAKTLALGTISEAVYCSVILLVFGTETVNAWQKIDRCESAAKREQEKGVKSFERNAYQRMVRMGIWTGLVACCAITPFMYFFPLFRIYACMVMPFTAGCLWISYLVSIDRPPCAKSKVLAFLGSLAKSAKGIFVPASAPVPVAVPVSTMASL